MKPPDEVRIDASRRWLVKADEDLQAAEELLASGSRLRSVVAFHCQQAAEKYLKALLVCRQIDFPKTHDIKRLLDLLSRIEPQIAEALREAETLTPFGVEVRYPDDSPEVLPGEDQQAVQTARLVRAAVAGRLDRGVCS